MIMVLVMMMKVAMKNIRSGGQTKADDEKQKWCKSEHPVHCIGVEWGDHFDNFIILRDGNDDEEQKRCKGRSCSLHSMSVGVVMVITNKEMMVKDCILFIAITILKLAKVKLRLMTTVWLQQQLCKVSSIRQSGSCLMSIENPAGAN